MKRTLILFSLALMVAGCQSDYTQTQPTSMPDTIVTDCAYNGHQYIIFRSTTGYGVALQVLHDPDCPCQSKTLTEWQQLQLAIIMTESKGNPNARGKDGDYGLYQMLPCYVSEVNRVSGSCYSHEDAFDADKAIDMFNRLQGHYNKERDIDKAIYYHNKASHYRKAVYNTMRIVERYEIARRKIIEYGN